MLVLIRIHIVDVIGCDVRSTFSLGDFFYLGFTPCKTEQPLRGIKLQEKEVQKD